MIDYFAITLPLLTPVHIAAESRLRRTPSFPTPRARDKRHTSPCSLLDLFSVIFTDKSKSQENVHLEAHHPVGASMYEKPRGSERTQYAYRALPATGHPLRCPGAPLLGADLAPSFFRGKRPKRLMVPACPPCPSSSPPSLPHCAITDNHTSLFADPSVTGFTAPSLFLSTLVLPG